CCQAKRTSPSKSPPPSPYNQQLLEQYGATSRRVHVLTTAIGPCHCCLDRRPNDRTAGKPNSRRWCWPLNSCRNRPMLYLVLLLFLQEGAPTHLREFGLHGQVHPTKTGSRSSVYQSRISDS